MRSSGHQFIVLLTTLILAALLVGILLWRMRVAGEAETASAVPKHEPVSRVSLAAAWPGGLAPSPAAFVLMRPLDVVRLGPATRFDYPLGTENGALSYNAQPFGENGHLGDDLNGIGGWDSDFGDPVFSVGRGRVVFAGRPSEGWGNMVMVAQRLDGGATMQSVYAHLDKVRVRVDDGVHRGDLIGTVGKGAGQYLAHLHFEMRTSWVLNPGAGYFEGNLDRLSPEVFLEENRGADPRVLTPAPRWRPAGDGPGVSPALEIRVEAGEAGEGGEGPEGGAEGAAENPGAEAQKRGRETARELRQ